MSTGETTHTLRWILGDQLNIGHRWFRENDPGVLYVIAELHQECTYVAHHVQKLCAFFSAMRQFAESLSDAGHRVAYLTLDETAGFAAVPQLVKHLAKKYDVTRFEYQRPDEYRLLNQFRELKLADSVELKEFDTEHFLLPFEEIETEFRPATSQRMEAFYRRMRRRFGYLMDGDSPEGGRWNFDQDNRQKLRPADLDEIPEPLVFEQPVDAILERLKRHEIAHFGHVGETLLWPTSRHQALALLRHFCTHCLAYFGRFQDAMTANSPHRWSLYHSRLSFALNAKLLSPAEVLERAIATYREREDISLAQIEGFVRQVVGWREFIRGVYWINMPDYGRRNHYGSTRPLPGFYWTGDTRMRCMNQAIGQSLDTAYAHHIQRLMLTGNFALLAGLDPDAVDAWYLGIYVDAIEWVEMPNTRGMALFADGGLVASKPYAAGGNYINKMSDYCKDCFYRVREKTGDRACPFNSLFWHFMHRHREELSGNQRLRMLFGNWDRQTDAQRQAVLDRAEAILNDLESL